MVRFAHLVIVPLLVVTVGAAHESETRTWHRTGRLKWVFWPEGLRRLSAGHVWTVGKGPAISVTSLKCGLATRALLPPALHRSAGRWASALPSVMSARASVECAIIVERCSGAYLSLSARHQQNHLMSSINVRRVGADIVHEDLEAYRRGVQAWILMEPAQSWDFGADVSEYFLISQA